MGSSKSLLAEKVTTELLVIPATHDVGQGRIGRFKRDGRSKWRRGASEGPSMRPYSAAREAPTSAGAARPLVLATVLLTMILLLLYLLTYLPLSRQTTSAPTSTPSSIHPKFKSNGSSKAVVVDDASTPLASTSTPAPTGIYAFVDRIEHRRQIPLIHQPFLYAVRLKVFLPWKPSVSFGEHDFALDGDLRMHFVSGGGTRILLHSVDQHVGDCTLVDEFDRRIEIKQVSRAHSQLLDFELAHEMIAGMNYTLDVPFRGHISVHRQDGVFASPYTSSGEKRFLTATHLQMSEARSVFPCVDVPEMKARFEATIEHPRGTHAVSNTMDTNTTHSGNWTVTSFHRTPPMSTYLFAFAVSDFPFIETRSSKGIRIRVYCDPSKIADSQLMLNSTGPLLDFFEDYFGIPYPLDKLDVFILPGLSVTAMENWGMITARQAESLYNPRLFPLTQKQHVQEVIAHEVAHQWFGNLVTMKWWNNLWLNEGFATMISLRAVDFLENTTLRYPEMTAEYMCIVLRTDQADAQTFPVSSKGDEEVFNSNQRPRLITYRKAAMIIRMVERLVEEDIFRTSLHHFLNKFMYKNADQDDLYAVLAYVHDSSSGGHLTGQNFSLADVMDTWLGQESVPIVYVTRREGSIVTLRQQRYKHIPSTPESKRDAYVWKIPIFYDDPVSSKHKVFWLVDKQPAVFDMGLQVVLDPYQLTYMRIRYDDSMYADITQRLLTDHNSIPSNSRSRLLDDTMAMAEYGQVSYEVSFNISMYLPNEETFRPFHVFNAYLDFFLPRLYLEPGYDDYRAWLIMILGTQFARMMKEGFNRVEKLGTHEDKLRELIVFRACGIGYEPCVEFARQLFAELRVNCSSRFLSDVDCNKIPFYLRPHVYSTAVQYGTDDDFEFLREKWLAEHYMMERDRIWSGLSATTKKENVYRIWTELLQNKARDSIRERSIAFSKFLRSENHLLSFLHDQAPLVIRELRKAGDNFHAMLTCALRGINNQEQFELAKTTLELYKEFKVHPASLGSVQARFKWRSEMRPFVVGNATLALRHMRRHRSDAR